MSQETSGRLGGTLVVGIAFDSGALLASDTRVHSQGRPTPVDGIGKLAVAPWGLVSGGGQTDVLARVTRSLVRRANPSVAEVHAVVSLALDTAGPTRPTELVFSHEPRGPFRPIRPSMPRAESTTLDGHPAPRCRVSLYRDQGELAPLAPVRIGLLPPADVDEGIVRDWVRQTQTDLFAGSTMPPLNRAVAAVLGCFAVLGPLSREVSPDLDLAVHEGGRRFRFARLWW